MRWGFQRSKGEVVGDIYGFSAGDIKKIAEAVRKALNTGGLPPTAGGGVAQNYRQVINGCWAKITSNTTFTTNRAKYDLTQVVPCDLTTDNSGFNELSGAATFTDAINAAESGNSGSGTLGDGETVANVTAAGFSWQPVPNGRVVWLTQYAGSGPLYRFSATTISDGSCSG
jgi:hypothetical protein